MNNIPTTEERVVVSSRYRDYVHLYIFAGIITMVGYYYYFQFMRSIERITLSHNDKLSEHSLLVILYGPCLLFAIFAFLLYRFHFITTALVLTKDRIILPSKDFLFGVKKTVLLASVVKIIVRGDLLAEKRIKFLSITGTGKGGANVNLGSEKYCLQGGIVIVFSNGENIRLNDDYYSSGDIEDFVQALLDRRPDIEVVER